ncbi:glutamate/aspartate ABC transporter substrate-binding protein [Paramixta manurensis]
MVVGVGLVAVSAAGAEELAGTLKKINDSNVVVVGYRESNVPFSYQDDGKNVMGYSQEYSNKIVEAIKKKLNKPNLEVSFLPITSPNRIPLLNNKVYDFECGSTTNNKERQQQVDFSDSIFVAGTRLMAKKGSGINDFPDLQGKAVVTSSGSTSEILLNQLNSNKNMKMRIISAKEGGTSSFQTLESGRAAAFMMDDALLAGDRAKARHPDQWVIVGTAQSHEAYGCMMRKNDPQFAALVNDTVAGAQTSGEAAGWYKKWFMQPIPPKGLNMNFEMSTEMKDLFAHPNNHAL